MDTDTTEFSALLTLGHIAIWRACHHGFPCSFSFVWVFLVGHECFTPYHVLCRRGCKTGMEQGGILFYIPFACFLNGGILLRLVRGGSLYMAPRLCVHADSLFKRRIEPSRGMGNGNGNDWGMTYFGQRGFGFPDNEGRISMFIA